ncbi:hypothetical protein HYG81_15430 [Natrinema zhouii]|uniref:Uncharacterized protein n=1 Tax=Natrinema zhouii TaxID=1710539 RepID=A0A7D6GJT9_9EURY|nr:hypothetical protein [Natrinema zhouii]QLK25460.1 hypothetical protein HYG81_15430 [Natrinema zhouii]
MPSLDLDAFVARTAALVDSSPPTTLRETRTWLVEPFLEALGWTVRTDACVTDRVVDDVRLEYVPTVESVPALFVAVEPATESLTESRANALRRAMAWTGVDRAIYTNGRQYLLLAGTTDIEYWALECAELAANESMLAGFSRATIGQRLGRHTRSHVARQLAVDRPTLVESVADRLADATVQGDIYAEELETATARFLDQLVVAFAEDGAPPPDDDAAVSVQFSESAITDDGVPSAESDPDSRSRPGSVDRDSDATETTDADGTLNESSVDTDSSTDTELETEDDTNQGGTGQSGLDTRDGVSEPTAVDSNAGASESEARGDSEDGEYVVRFFNDRSSIGAIGHSTSAGALVEAADYLLERGLAGVDVPWSPEETDRTILNADPTHADGSPMDDPERLANGFVLETAGDINEHAARVEALAARAGLRAMLTGDWG